MACCSDQNPAAQKLPPRPLPPRLRILDVGSRERASPRTSRKFPEQVDSLRDRDERSSGKISVSGGEFAGLEKLGLSPKALQNLWGSAEPFFNRLFTMRNVLQNLAAEPQRFCRILGNLWEPRPVFSVRFGKGIFWKRGLFRKVRF